MIVRRKNSEYRKSKLKANEPTTVSTMTARGHATKLARKEETGNRGNSSDTNNDHKNRLGKNARKLDNVDKAMLGAAPTDRADDIILDDLGTSEEDIGFNSAERLRIVRNFLEEQPQLRAELTKEISEAWKRAGKRRDKFLKAIDERRIEIMSRAEINNLNRQAPQSIATLRHELSRYLDETGGFV